MSVEDFFSKVYAKHVERTFILTQVGNTALHDAVLVQSAACVRVLLLARADTNIRNSVWALWVKSRYQRASIATSFFVHFRRHNQNPSSFILVNFAARFNRHGAPFRFLHVVKVPT